MIVSFLVLISSRAALSVICKELSFPRRSVTFAETFPIVLVPLGALDLADTLFVISFSVFWGTGGLHRLSFMIGQARRTITATGLGFVGGEMNKEEVAAVDPVVLKTTLLAIV